MEKINKENNQSKQATSESAQNAGIYEPVEVKDAEALTEETASKEQAEPVAKEEKEQINEVDSLKKQLTEMNDRYIRLMAEFDNYKKRISREYERQVESANEKLMIEMVDVRENFERALRSGESGADLNTLFDGMKLIFNKFDSVLSRNGLEHFAEVGDAFDPQIHDALMKTPNENIPEDHIAEIYERGYKLKSKIIKHAKVIVTTTPPPPDNTEN